MEDLSHTLRAVYTVNGIHIFDDHILIFSIIWQIFYIELFYAGSHCLDLLPSLADDPEWLVKQRKTELNIVTKWINKYYVDLKQVQSQTISEEEEP